MTRRKQFVTPAFLAQLMLCPEYLDQRHAFVPEDLHSHAYENRPLPIGYGQTISQPYIVAIMTELLQLQASDKVLEVGTGSGYQAAILSALVDKVYTIEIIEPLGKRAKKTAASTGL